MKIIDGSSALITVMLMIVILSVAVIGLVVFVNTMDESNAAIANDSVNLTGITTSGEIYNGTNSTLHSIATISPNMIWIAFIALVVTFISLLAIGLGRR